MEADFGYSVFVFLCVILIAYTIFGKADNGQQSDTAVDRYLEKESAKGIENERKKKLDQESARRFKEYLDKENDRINFERWEEIFELQKKSNKTQKMLDRYWELQRKGHTIKEINAILIQEGFIKND